MTAALLTSPNWRRAAALLLVAGALLSLACATGRAPARPPRPTLTPEEAKAFEQLFAWEQARVLPSELTSWCTSHARPRVRARCQRALARLQAWPAASTVAAGLSDPDAEVRREAAFAAAALGVSWEAPEDAERDGLAQQVATALKDRPAPERAPLARALGDLGGPVAKEALSALVVGKDLELAGAAALALGVAAKRGLEVGDAPLAAAVELVKGPEVEVRYAAVYLLAHAKRAWVRPSLVGSLGDGSPEVRALAAKGLGELGTPEDVRPLTALLMARPARVAAEAARAIAKLARKCGPADCPVHLALARLADEAPASRLAILAVAQQGLPAAFVPTLELLRSGVRGGLAHAKGPVRRDLIHLDCRLSAALARATLDPAILEQCALAKSDRARADALLLGELAAELESLGQVPPEARGRLLAVADPGRYEAPAARAAAVGLVAAGKLAEHLPRVRELVASEDDVLAGAAIEAAAALGDTASSDRILAQLPRVSAHPDLADALGKALVALKPPAAAQALQGLLDHPHVHVRQCAARALSKLTGRRVRASASRPAADQGSSRSPGPPEGKMPPGNARVRIVTERGDVVVRLLTDEAPATASNLYRLAAAGYFKANSFHRVVPDFVAQGGDPRGDGNGGPGYTLPCEVNPTVYARGAVGMALSGKDTGGSQFFITTSPQPHLDRRYTLFGQVEEGMEVADLLFEGEPILDVRPVP